MPTGSDSDAPPAKRRGRPPTGKRGTFSFRVTDSLRTKLEAEAARLGRPVSEEIEMRLEASFQSISPHTEALVSVIRSAVNIIEVIMNGRWTENRAIALEAKAAIESTLDYLMANPAATHSKRLADALLAPDFRPGDAGRALVHVIGRGQVLPGEATPTDEAAVRQLLLAVEMGRSGSLAEVASKPKIDEDKQILIRSKREKSVKT